MGPTDMFQYIHATYMDQVQPPSTILLHQALPKLLQPQFYAQVSCLCNFCRREGTLGTCCPMSGLFYLT